MLLERESELAELSAAIDAGVSGDARFTIVEGLPGVGKTRLLDEARQEARERDCTVLSARGSRLESEYPFGIVRQLFDPILWVAGSERDELLSGAASLAAPVFADTAPQPTAPDATFATLHGLFWLISNLADRSPLVLFIDDLHWADSSSLRLIAFLNNRLEGLRLAVLAASRPLSKGVNGGAPAADLIAHLRSEPNIRLLPVEPLSEAATASLVKEGLGTDAPGDVVEACFSLTGGNPFMLTELVRELQARGQGGQITAAQITDARPERIVDAVLARIDHIGSNADRLCRSLAVIGDHADLSLLAKHAGTEPGDAHRLVEVLASAGVLQSTLESMDFMHPLIRTAVYERIPPDLASEEHERAADLLLREGASPEAVAGQLMHVRAGSADPALVGRLREAAQAAITRGASDIAVRFLERALAEPLEGENRAAVLLELSAATLLAGRGTGLELLEEALELASDPGLRAQITYLLGEVHFMNGQAEASLTHIQRVLEWAESTPEAPQDLLARSQGLVLGLAVYSPAPRRALSERFQSICRTAESPDAPVAFLGTAAIEQGMASGTADRVASLVQRAIEADVVAQLTADAISVHHVAGAAILAGRLDWAEALVARALEDARRRGSAIGFSYSTCLSALVNHRLGRLVEVEADAEVVLGHGLGELNNLATMVVRSVLIKAHIDQGRLAEAEAVTRAALETPVEPDMIGYQDLRKAIADLRLAQSRPRDAIAALDDILSWEREWGGATGAWTESYRLSALAHHQLGDSARAEEVARKELDRAERFGAQWYIGSALSTLATVGPPEDAEATMRAAVEALGASQYRLRHARSLVDLGALLRRAGRDRDARDPLEEGRAIAARLGVEALESRALEELIAAGARPRLRTKSPQDLTPSERRVASRAADGLSNREIAQELFVTQKTVETHLSNVYRKLEISSRAQLPEHLEAQAPA